MMIYMMMTNHHTRESFRELESLPAFLLVENCIKSKKHIAPIKNFSYLVYA